MQILTKMSYSWLMPLILATACIALLMNVYALRSQNTTLEADVALARTGMEKSSSDFADCTKQIASSGDKIKARDNEIVEAQEKTRVLQIQLREAANKTERVKELEEAVKLLNEEFDKVDAEKREILDLLHTEQELRKALEDSIIAADQANAEAASALAAQQEAEEKAKTAATARAAAELAEKAAEHKIKKEKELAAKEKNVSKKGKKEKGQTGATYDQEYLDILEEETLMDDEDDTRAI